MYKGSCLCGTVCYQIEGKIDDIVCCHCSQCRKAQGSAFATNGNVKTSGFHFISGEHNMTAYESAPGEFKYFCKTCGSPVMKKTDKQPQLTRIRLGLLESDITERPAAHIFTASKANWDEIYDDLPRFTEKPDKTR